MNQKFKDALNLSPEDQYYKSEIITIDGEEDLLEIKSDKPIQVRINNGPWVDVRSLDTI
jgi:hypothetical protein